MVSPWFPQCGDEFGIRSIQDLEELERLVASQLEDLEELERLVASQNHKIRTRLCGNRGVKLLSIFVLWTAANTDMFAKFIGHSVGLGGKLLAKYNVTMANEFESTHNSSSCASPRWHHLPGQWFENWIAEIQTNYKAIMAGDPLGPEDSWGHYLHAQILNEVNNFCLDHQAFPVGYAVPFFFGKPHQVQAAGQGSVTSRLLNWHINPRNPLPAGGTREPEILENCTVDEVLKRQGYVPDEPLTNACTFLRMCGLLFLPAALFVVISWLYRPVLWGTHPFLGFVGALVGARWFLTTVALAFALWQDRALIFCNLERPRGWLRFVTLGRRKAYKQIGIYAKIVFWVADVACLAGFLVGWYAEVLDKPIRFVWAATIACSLVSVLESED